MNNPHEPHPSTTEATPAKPAVPLAPEYTAQLSELSVVYTAAVSSSAREIRPRRRRSEFADFVFHPATLIVLFLTTCVTVYFAGAAGWMQYYLGQFPIKPLLTDAAARTRGWQYAVAVMAILVAHEMGHFLMTIRHRVPASWPLFLPWPSLFTGTMGAVIAMDGRRANRRQLFDIGIAGPLAGLVLIVPILCYGIAIAKSEQVIYPAQVIGDPLLVELLTKWFHPQLAANQELVLNPWYMAGWVGCLITGLNMMPLGQLDGGHVLYGLFGRRANYLARTFLLFAMAWMVWTDSYMWLLMLVLITLMGVDHPPTADDQVKLGWGRTLLGIAAQAIPVLCFIPRVF